MTTATFDELHGGVRHHPKLAAIAHHVTVAIAVTFVVLTALAIILWLAQLLAIGRLDPPPRPDEVRAVQAGLAWPARERRTIISYVHSSDPSSRPSS